MPVFELKSLFHSPRSFLKTCRAIRQSWGKKEVLVIGDSHAAVFASDNLRRAFPRIYFDLWNVNAASISGLKNVNSKTQAYRKFTKTLSRSRATTVIVQLGEVDAGNVIWLRAEKHGRLAAEMLAETVLQYGDFLAEIRDGGRQVICISAPLPTIPDGADWGEVARARKDIRACQMERTTLTLEFNQMVADWCVENGVIHLNLDRDSMGADGLVNPRLLNSSAADHHYDESAYSALLNTALGPLLHG